MRFMQSHPHGGQVGGVNAQLTVFDPNGNAIENGLRQKLGGGVATGELWNFIQVTVVQFHQYRP